MRKDNDTLTKQTPSQSNCYTASPEDFEPMGDGVPFHGQRGDSEGEYQKLLKLADVHGKSPFGKKARGPRRSSLIEPS
jgi:hypothetical protein